ncbi:family 25 glycosyltransferase [Pseudomassariella vexata]|uniref:Family 25 glycosyltransferase n=1 Tax=Pseudomassariella vexata TaxID=1141098 RepID=A0A1Y2D611_9PEZI|nr:family 25 glycosyltransferase [Pseudomassariella vexata]ORY54723.1 family 25 glycosyltransferase [Pseudomassariella vexata]
MAFLQGKLQLLSQNVVSPKPRLRLAALAIVIVLILCTQRRPEFGFTLPVAAPPPSTKPASSTTKHLSTTDINRVTNNTLGFSKIFALGLPDRSDKRDAVALSSALTGFHVQWVDGVRGESVPDKAIPFGTDRQRYGQNELGCWRAHMNAARMIVEENLESALIMEDDVDRDVRLKTQLEQIATGTRTLLGTSSSSPSSPYGDDWDVLWMGHCGEPFPELLPENVGKPADHPGIQYMKQKFVIENDVTVPPPDKVTGLLDFKANPYTRWVHIGAAPICTFAYALSQRGARKVLYDLSVDHLSGPIDNALADLCRRSVSAVGEEPGGDDGLQTKCISVNPPLFFSHRRKGPIHGDSDIHNIVTDEVRDKGFTENIMWSARNNIRNMIMGSEMENQF